MLKSLYFWVVFAIAGGVLLGWLAPDAAVEMKPLGDGFIKLIKMMIAPVIFCTVVTGIAGMRNLRNVGRVGLKSLIYFEAVTTLALLIGLFVVNTLEPGAGMHVDPATLDSKAVESYVNTAHQQGNAVDFLLGIIPATLTDAFVTGNMLQVLLVSLLFAAGLVMLGDKGRGMYDLIQQFSLVLFKIIGIIVWVAPLGAFGAMAFTVGKYGIAALGPLMGLMLTFYATCILFVALVLGAVMRLCGLRLWPFLRYIREELLIVLGTSSSEAVLPRMIDRMTQLGCAKPVVGMVIPTGYSFNLDGTSIYLTMAAVFLAQATGTALSLGDQVTLLLVLLLTSKGAAGVTGSGFVVLAATLASVDSVPVESLALILGIDRFMSEARALTNLVGNGVATVAVAKWEGALDEETAKQALGMRHGA